MTNAEGPLPGAAAPERSRRERILDAAEELFATHGFDATSTREIAVRAGVPTGLVFYHFRTKDALLETLLDERNVLARIRESYQSLEPGDIEASLRSFGRHLYELVHPNPNLFALAMRESQLPTAMGERLREERQRMVRFTSGLLEQAVREKRLAAVDTDTMARVFLSGIAWAALMEPLGDPLRFIEEATGILLHDHVPAVVGKEA